MIAGQHSPRQPPIVPSKNALRALRRLAFSPATLVLSTIGSACGVATLNHEIYRRIHLAEQAVESKRILRSLSHGGGTARLKAMIDAAERGEDFTSRPRGPRKKRRKINTTSISTANTTTRSFSAVSLQEAVDPSVDQDGSEGALLEQVYPVHTPLFRHEQRPTTYRRFRPRPLSMRTLGAEKILEVSRASQKLQTHRIYGRPPPREASGEKRAIGLLQRWPKPEDNPSSWPTSDPTALTSPGSVMDSTLGNKPTLPTPHTPRTAVRSEPISAPPITNADLELGDTPLQTSGGLSSVANTSTSSVIATQAAVEDVSTSTKLPQESRVPLPSLAERMSSTVELSAPIATAEGPSTLLPPRSFSDPVSVESNLETEQNPQVASSSLVESRPEVSSAIPGLSSTDSFAQPDTGLGLQPVAAGGVVGQSKRIVSFLSECLDDEAPDPFLQHQFEAAYRPQTFRRGDGMLHLPTMPPSWAPDSFLLYAQEHLDVDLFLFVRRDAGLEKKPGYRPTGRWRRAMRFLAANPSPRNWTIAEALVYDFLSRPSFKATDLHFRAFYRLIEHLLATDPSSERAQHLLFHDTDLNPFTLSTRYLQFFCETHHDPFYCLQELGCIVDIGTRCELRPPPSLFIPVLRAVVRAEDFEMAANVLERLDFELGTADSLAVLEQYAFLNACAGHWRVVEDVLDRFHTMNRSRETPVDHGRLFQRLLAQHVAKHSAAQSFDFTIQSMKHSGVIPTSSISITLVGACIRDRRYDLVAEWLLMLREAFPRVSPGFRLLQGSWLLADTLLTHGLSCEEISRVCHGIAHGHRKDPFGPAFRHFTVDMVKADLSRRLCIASSHLSGGKSSQDICSMTLQEILEYTYEIRAKPMPTDSNGAIFEGLKNDLAVQTSAIVDLAKTFRGDWKMLLNGYGIPHDALSKRSRDVADDAALTSGCLLRRKFPQFYRDGTSPSISELQTALAREYDDRQRQGLPLDHALLKELITSVGPEYPLEVLDFVEEVYQSSVVLCDVAHFDTELVKKWLYLVSTDGTASSAVTVLSAVVSLADRLEWTFHFRTLCDLVAQLGSSNSTTLSTHRKYTEPPTNPFLRSLYLKIRRISDQRGQKESFCFPAWKGWDMDARAE